MKNLRTYIRSIRFATPTEQKQQDEKKMEEITAKRFS
jgi:hypothetical protein